VQAEQQIVSGSPFRAAASGTRLFQAGKAAMPGQPFAQGLPIAGVEGFERGRREGRFASGAGFPDRPAGVAETIAHFHSPGLVVELNERLEFAQVLSSRR
jgi:hypothetical protein